METYTIRELSKTFNLPASTLRYYEEINLLPDVQRINSYQRVYTQKHYKRVNAICCLKEAGMSLADIKEFFEYKETENSNIHDMVELLNKTREEFLQNLQQSFRVYEHLLKKVRFYSDVEISIKNKEARPTWDSYDDSIFTKKAKEDFTNLINSVKESQIE